MLTNSALQKGSLRLYFKVTSVVLTAKQSWTQEVYQTPGYHHERSASDLRHGVTQRLPVYLFKYKIRSMAHYTYISRNVMISDISPLIKYPIKKLLGQNHAAFLLPEFCLSSPPRRQEDAWLSPGAAGSGEL